MRIERVTEIARGDLANLSRMELGAHTGTHVDAPLHFVEGAPAPTASRWTRSSAPPSSPTRGRRGATSTPAALAALGIPGHRAPAAAHAERRPLGAREFTRDYVGVADDAARELVAMGVRLLGIDYLSIAPSADPRRPTGSCSRRGW